MAKDQYETTDGRGHLQDRYGRNEFVLVDKHQPPTSTDVQRGYEWADPDGRQQMVLLDEDGLNLNETTRYAVRTTDASQPLNLGKVRLSLATDAAPDGFTDAEDELDVDLTTPQSLQILTSRYDDLDRLVSPNPGVYNWGLGAYEVNIGDAPVTALFARARGRSVFATSSSGRAYGVDATVHGIEITAGIWPSRADVTANGTSVVSSIVPTQPGSRFEAGMPVTISGTGLSLPGGTTILSVAGRPGAPTSITLSNPVTGSGAGAIVAQATGTLDGIGLLITGSTDNTNGTADQLGAAVQSQQQNDKGRWGVGFQAGGLQLSGKAFRVSLQEAARALSVESSTLEEGVAFASTEFSNAGIYFSTGVTANYGIRFSSDGVYTLGAIYLPSQNITTDTTDGMKIASTTSQKLGFYGKTPIAQPTLSDAATDPATTQTLANNLRTTLINLGLGA